MIPLSKPICLFVDLKTRMQISHQAITLVWHILFLHTNGTPHQSHNILKLVVAVELELLVDGVAFDEVLLENGVSPFSKSNTLFAFHTIAYRCYHLKTEILYH